MILLQDALAVRADHVDFPLTLIFEKLFDHAGHFFSDRCAGRVLGADKLHDLIPGFAEELGVMQPFALAGLEETRREGLLGYVIGVSKGLS